jgi:hypothetical protein
VKTSLIDMPSSARADHAVGWHNALSSPRIELSDPKMDPASSDREFIMRDIDFMSNAGFTVPFGYEPTAEVPGVEATAIQGEDLILRVGDFPLTASQSEDLLARWSSSANFDISGVDAHQALDILFITVLSSAVVAEHSASGRTGFVPMNVTRLRREGAPERFAHYCERIDGGYIMAVLVDQFDRSVALGVPVWKAVARRQTGATPRRASIGEAFSVDDRQPQSASTRARVVSSLTPYQSRLRSVRRRLRRIAVAAGGPAELSINSGPRDPESRCDVVD